jgi:hypothetical protein
MSSPSPRVSTRLKRAAVAERALLAKRRERVERERVGVRTELERLERELADIDEHLELLVRIAPSGEGDAQPTRRNGDAPRQQEPGVKRVLQGPAIRATAVRLLVERDPPVDAIHYRDWYRLLQEHGFAVAGRKPLAVFLSQVSRSPLMRKATSAGVYALDRDAAERRRRELSQLEAELHALTTQSPNRPAHGQIQTRRRELLLAIGRHERALDEALRDLTPAEHGAPDHARPQRGQRP